MSRWLFVWFCFWVGTISAQVSFIRNHPIPENFDVTAYAELTNGNFVCCATSATKHMIYLFDKCGNMLTSLQLNAMGDYMGIQSIVDLDSNRFLASGWIRDSTIKSIHVILNSNDLGVQNQKKYFETLPLVKGNAQEVEGRILLAGVRDDRVYATQLNEQLNRNLYVQRVFNSTKHPEFEHLNWVGTQADRIYINETYTLAGTHDHYSKIRCLDRKLNDKYIINFRPDTLYYVLNRSICYLGGDTILIGPTIHNEDWSQHEDILLKYYKDTLISRKEITPDKNFSRYSTCIFNGERIRCVNYDGVAAEFDRNGNLLFADDHLTSILKEGDMSDAFLTMDGGFFSARHIYIPGGHAMKLIKITADYSLDSLPSPECMVGTQDDNSSHNVLVYPNPAHDFFYVQASQVISQFMIYNLEGELLAQGKPEQKEFDVQLNLIPGLFVLYMQSGKDWITQKILILE